MGRREKAYAASMPFAVLALTEGVRGWIRATPGEGDVIGLVDKSEEVVVTLFTLP